MVVFGVADGEIVGDDDTLQAVADETAAVVGPAGQAKQLADELEVLEAVRAALAVPASPVERVMAALANVAAEALSCELGIVYLEDGERVVVAERGWTHAGTGGGSRRALEARPRRAAGSSPASRTPASRLRPACSRRIRGIRSYYVLELTGLAEACCSSPTPTCRRAASPCSASGSACGSPRSSSVVLGVALTRESIAAESARLQGAFAELEASAA